MNKAQNFIPSNWTIKSSWHVTLIIGSVGLHIAWASRINVPAKMGRSFILIHQLVWNNAVDILPCYLVKIFVSGRSVFSSELIIKDCITSFNCFWKRISYDRSRHIKTGYITTRHRRISICYVNRFIKDLQEWRLTCWINYINLSYLGRISWIYEIWHSSFKARVLRQDFFSIWN